MKLRNATTEDLAKVDRAIDCLRVARELLKEAGAHNTVKRVRLALTSAGGARRHVTRCLFNAEQRIDQLCDDAETEAIIDNLDDC